MTTRPLYLKQLELGPMQNFVYLVGDPATREAAVVDPGWEVPTILKTLAEDGYRLTHIFATHAHFDHVMGLPALLKHHDVPVYVNRDEAASMDVAPSVLRPMDSGDIIHVGEVPIRLIHTPGHTPGSQCLLIDGQLLSGDTLFIRACGRCDLPGGDPEALYHSLTNTLKKLDDQTILHPGHNYADVPTSTIGQEKKDNPFLQIETVERFRKLVGC
jgi:glyoxylase-like metal-dependent hydrolase (beta-lactamase superfamily II)